MACVIALQIARDVHSQPFGNSHIFSLQLSQGIYAAHPLSSVGAKGEQCHITIVGSLMHICGLMVVYFVY